MAKHRGSKRSAKSGSSSNASKNQDGVKGRGKKSFKKFFKNAKALRKSQKTAKKPKIRIPMSKLGAWQKKIREDAKAETAIKKLHDQAEKMWFKRLNELLSNPYTRQLLIDLAGENTLEIVKNFNGCLSDEDIAKKLKLKISDVRATLNKLHNVGLVTYMRAKDSKTGWYSYSWSLNRDRIENWVSDNSNGSKILAANGGDHYFCPGCGLESLISFEAASEVQFRCPDCNKSLEFLEQEKLLDNEFLESFRKKF